MHTYIGDADLHCRYLYIVDAYIYYTYVTYVRGFICDLASGCRLLDAGTTWSNVCFDLCVYMNSHGLPPPPVLTRASNHRNDSLKETHKSQTWNLPTLKTVLTPWAQKLLCLMYACMRTFVCTGGRHDPGRGAADVHVLRDLPPRDPAAGGRLHDRLHLLGRRACRFRLQGRDPDGTYVRMVLASTLLFRSRMSHVFVLPSIFCSHVCTWLHTHTLNFSWQSLLCRSQLHHG